MIKNIKGLCALFVFYITKSALSYLLAGIITVIPQNKSARYNVIEVNDYAD